jgi:predicted anti-sigma-YlaC factor YlaD
MKCSVAQDKLAAHADSELDPAEQADLRTHIDGCPDCRLALRGIEALTELRERELEAAPNGLFERVVERAVADSTRQRANSGFWKGAGFGAVAASLLALAFALTLPDQPDANRAAEFTVAVGETRQMDLAFETDRALAGATITILLAGSVEIDGYGTQRELTWSEDLDAGVNRLSLPVMASGFEGGQMVVRLEHPLSEQVFVVQLPVEG